MTHTRRTLGFLPLVLCSLAIFAARPGSLRADPTTALQDFINAPDPTFAWSDVNTITGPGYTADVLNMTSQTWLTPDQVDRPNWQNYVTVIRPSVVTTHEALLYIDGGSNGCDEIAPGPYCGWVSPGDGGGVGVGAAGCPNFS